MIEIEVEPGVYKRTADLPSQFSIKTVTDSDYIIEDGDGYDIIFVSTGEGDDRTITLPTAEFNSGRKIRVMKIDDASKKVIVDGENAEKIFEGNNEYETKSLSVKNEKIDVLCDGTSWWNTNFFGIPIEIINGDLKIGY